MRVVNGNVARIYVDCGTRDKCQAVGISNSPRDASGRIDPAIGFAGENSQLTDHCSLTAHGEQVEQRDSSG